MSDDRTAGPDPNIPGNHQPEPSAAATWESKAACTSVPAATFFLERYLPRHPDVQAAKAICGACPVLDDCRAYTLAHPGWTSDGIWAAMTPSERRRARKATDERTAA
ncbi:WhiB family transcriptional regulator [Nonomuraea rubra]|uniref:WhiB family transcriptional regulator n=1 Tax=Nonomuraea rubra TaxID=46180 RepID=UPI0033FCBC4A